MFDPVLEELAKRYAGQVPYVAGDIGRVAALWGNEATRPRAEALLKQWIETGEPLRKGVATVWLARAKGMIGSAAKGAVKNAKRLREKVMPTADSIPSSEYIPEHSGNARSVDAHHASLKHANAAVGEFPGHDEFGDDAAKRRDVHIKIRDAFHGGYSRGAYQGHQDATSAYMRGQTDGKKVALKVARKTAKYAFGAGALAGGAAVGAVGHALSQKQHDERKTAAQARWSGHTRNSS